MDVAVAVRRPRPPRSRAWGARHTREAVGWLLVALVLLAWAVTLRPTQLGGPATWVVVSGDSMEPTLSDGDLVVLRSADRYAVGDVVTYPVPAGGPGAGSLVIHRVVTRDGGTLTTQGDNRDGADEWRPAEESVRGALWLQVPGVGRVLLRLVQPSVVAAAAGGGFTLWLLLRPPGATREHHRRKSSKEISPDMYLARDPLL